jgi:hypothetical protein
MPVEIWENFREVHALRRVECDPGTNVRRIAVAEDIGVLLVWRILHEEPLDPCHIHRVQAFSHLEHNARVGFASGFSQNA